MNKQQKAWLLLLVFVLTPVMAWTALGFPVDRVALGVMVSSVLAGVIGFAKLMLGSDRSGKKKRGKVTHCSGCLPRNKNCYIKRGCKKLANNEVKFCFECNDIPCANLVCISF